MAEDMSIESYLAQGGVLTNPSNVPPRYRAELMKLMTTFVDSELAGAAGVVLLIGQEDGLSAAVVVDAIEDQRQVVIKGLQESYGRVPGIAAATILGDGQIALILDPIDLIAQASGLTKISSAVSGPKSLSGSSSHGDFT